MYAQARRRVWVAVGSECVGGWVFATSDRMCVYVCACACVYVFVGVPELWKSLPVLCFGGRRILSGFARHQERQVGALWFQ